MDRFADTCEEIARQAGRLKKVAAAAGFLRQLDDADFLRAVRFFCADPGPKVSAGGAALRDAAAGATGYDDTLIRICNREAGDTAETIALLLHGKTAARAMTLADAEALYAELAAARRMPDKLATLHRIFTAYRPRTLKYFLKVITGNLRIGLQTKLVEEAIARSTGQSLDTVRQAANRSGDLAEVALAARRQSLDEVPARLFRPMDFMLARPLDSLTDLTEPDQWIIEDKYDGIRAQAHVENGKVKLFSRGMEEITVSYPELVLALAQVSGRLVLDGELLAWRGDGPLPFNALQQRLARKRITADLMAGVPVVLMAYDLLYDGGELVIDLPFEQRRARLEARAAGWKPPLLLSRQWQAATAEEVDRLFHDARGRANEGLVLKRRGSLYEAGKRGGAWLKLKRPFATLDVVITAAEQGRGRRATMLSDYTFAVRDGERFLNVGKAYTGLTDEEIRELTRLLRSLAVERFGRVTLVKPEVVLEVAFDGIQISPRHKSGFAMRFPRIVRWRKDKLVSEIDTLDRVRELYET